MNLNREIYSKFYKDYRSNKITHSVEDFINDDNNFAKLIDLNNIGIPPAISFIYLTMKDNKDLFDEYFDGNIAKHQYFGKLFGAAFRNKGLKPKYDNQTYLKSASVFVNE